MPSRSQPLQSWNTQVKGSVWSNPPLAEGPSLHEISAAEDPTFGTWSVPQSRPEQWQRGKAVPQDHYLLVKERLHELEMAYCRGVDRRDPDLLRSIFFEDALEEHGEMYRGPAVDFVDWVFNEFIGKYELTTHYVLNEWYRVAGDRAEGETHRISHHRIRTPEPKETIAACRTFNRYECRNGIWKISYRGVVRDWIYDRPFDESLFTLTRAGDIDEATALQYASSPTDLKLKLEGF